MFPWLAADHTKVLDMFPTLRLVWCHCGVSRRTFEETHHVMIDEMMTTYPNLNADISWVVWEDVICGPDGVPKVEKGAWFPGTNAPHLERERKGGGYLGPGEGVRWPLHAPFTISRNMVK